MNTESTTESRNDTRPHSRSRARNGDERSEYLMSSGTSSRSSARQTAFAYTCYALAIYLALLVASTISADGMRSLHSAFSIRLPFQFVFTLIGIRRFDLATFLAAAIVGMSFFFLDRSMRTYLLSRDSLPLDLLARPHRTVCSPLSLAFLVLDGIFFFLGVLRPSGWDTPSSLFSAIVLTGMYLCLMVGMAYLNIVWFLKPERN